MFLLLNDRKSTRKIRYITKETIETFANWHSFLIRGCKRDARTNKFGVKNNGF